MKDMTAKELVEKYGKEEFIRFDKWMTGKTVGISFRGEVVYYSEDINKFFINRNLKSEGNG